MFVCVAVWCVCVSVCVWQNFNKHLSINHGNQSQLRARHTYRANMFACLAVVCVCAVCVCLCVCMGGSLCGIICLARKFAADDAGYQCHRLFEDMLILCAGEGAKTEAQRRRKSKGERGWSREGRACKSLRRLMRH